MLITFSRKEIKKKSKNRPSGYTDELKSIATSVSPDGSMTFDTASPGWKKMQDKHKVHIKYAVQNSIQKIKSETLKTLAESPNPPAKKGGCGCGKH